jgi:L-amino acid N-acyltransferase YncA
MRFSSVAAPQDHRVRPAAKAFVEHRVNVLAASGQLTGQVGMHVLVELEPHARTGKISSRARAAP